MSKAKSTMDRISKWNEEARSLGLTYGKYVAIYHPSTPVVFPVHIKKTCPICGRDFLAKSKKRIYCSEACSEKAKRMREAERKEAEEIC